MRYAKNLTQKILKKKITSKITKINKKWDQNLRNWVFEQMHQYFQLLT